MATIKSENFDSAASPALPAGWLSGATVQTQTTQVVSSPIGFGNSAASNNDVGYWNTNTDGNGGDAQASATFMPVSSSGSGVLGYVYCRMTTPATTRAGVTGYCSVIQLGGVLPGLYLQKVVGGSSTPLGSLTSVVLSNSDRYRLYCRCVGTTITLRCQRLSDGLWVDASGTWQSGIQDAIVATSPTIAGAGKAGLAVDFALAVVDAIFADDFLFESIVSGGSVVWVETADGSVVNLAACFRLYIDGSGRLLAGFNFGDIVLAPAATAAAVLANVKLSLAGVFDYSSLV